MRKLRHKRLYLLAGIVIIVVAFMVGYQRRSAERARLNRPPRRSQPLAPQGVAEQQMLQGKFSQDVSAEQREIVAAELRASDQPSSSQPAETNPEARSGGQQIVPTQPVGTTVEETQPTFTWDTRLDGVSYQVHIEDQNSHQPVATSPALDEALWQVPTPLLRGHAYAWSVEAIPVGGRATAKAVNSSAAQFSVLSDEGEQEIQNARAHSASHLLLGSLYTHYEMWRDAVLEYRKMVDEVPDSPEAIKLLRNAELRASSKLAGGQAH